MIGQFRLDAACIDRKLRYYWQDWRKSEKPEGATESEMYLN